MPTWLSREHNQFPPLDHALREPNGLLALGGDLSPERLVQAYRHGCFPWYAQGQPLMWWSPDPRTVLYPERLHVSRSLAKQLRRGTFRVTYDQAFADVIGACAEPRDQASGTWITEAMRAAYCELHALGHAHSVEVWHGDALVGGLYGIAMGRLFFGESMFSRASDASKVGFVALVEQLRAWDFVLIDCQMQTRHLDSLGAERLSRQAFSAQLQQHLGIPGESNWGKDGAARG